MTYTSDIPAKTLSRFPKEQREVVDQALSLGWRGRVAGDGGVRLVPPAGHDRARPIYVPMTKVDSQRVKMLRREVVKVELGEQVVDAVMIVEQARADGLVTASPARAKPQPPAEPRVLMVNHGNGPVPEATVVSETPFLVHTSGKRTYPSERINERRWSNGMVDYTCRHPGCDYANASHLSVNGHQASHRGKAGKPTIIGVDETWQVTPRTEGAVKRLAMELRAAMELVAGENDGEVPDFKTLPDLLAQAIVQAREARREELEPVEDIPPTPEQLLERIKAMLMPDYIKREQALNQMVDLLSEAKERAERRAQRIHENFQAFRELLSDVEEESDDTEEQASPEAGGPAEGGQGQAG